VLPIEGSSTKCKDAQSQAEELFLEHGEFLMNVLSRDLPEPDALDAFQCFYLNVVMKGLPDNIKDIRGYLYQAARNAVIDHWRKTSTYQEKIRLYSQQTKPKFSEDPAKKVMQSELQIKVFEKIGHFLCPSINQVFVQKYQHDLDNDKIAEKMNISKRTVSSYSSVGTKQIQELYNRFFGDSDE